MPEFAFGVLRGRIWNNARRANEAASVPFRSLKMGEKDTAVDESINSLHLALERIESLSLQLPQKHLPIQRVVKQQVPNPAKLKQHSRFWGPFFIKFFKNTDKKRSTEEFGTGRYGELTFFAVRLFQEQAGFAVDGRAGRETLRRLDEILLFLESLD
jgi:hypothetical protein